MIRTALVGNIASGKSTVAKIISETFDYPVLDTDDVCRDLHKSLAPEIIAAFDKYCITNADGQISREKLGALVFDNLGLKQKLENIMHPAVKVEIEKFFDKNKNAVQAVVSVPLLFEAKMESMFDRIVFVYCDDEIRLNRLIMRNCYTAEYAKKRMNSQFPQDGKAQKSDIVIKNNSDIPALEIAVKKCFK